MKKKRITYGVHGMMEYQSIIKIGRATLKVLFTDGSMTAIGQNPAKYTTSDFLVQHAIENSSEFKRGRITVVDTIELDEEVRIERNPAKPSTQQAPSPAEAKPVAATAAKVEEPQDIADEPTEETNAVDADEAESASADTPATEVDIEPIEDEVPSTEEDAAELSENDNEEGLTEVEFSTNQEAKDYLTKTFGVKSGTMKNRADIVAIGEANGVKIIFITE
ncbi:MAG: hypothetical protein PUI39_04020 [Prevotella sp.]|nr:hypothetical protein [Prevotella sp.]